MVPLQWRFKNSFVKYHIFIQICSNSVICWNCRMKIRCSNSTSFRICLNDTIQFPGDGPEACPSPSSRRGGWGWSSSVLSSVPEIHPSSFSRGSNGVEVQPACPLLVLSYTLGFVPARLRPCAFLRCCHSWLLLWRARTTVEEEQMSVQDWLFLLQFPSRSPLLNGML